MSIIRTKKGEIPFAMIDKRLLDDQRLQWKSKGLLCYLLGKPDKWEVKVPDLVNKSKDGRDSVYAALKELRDAGYCRKVVKRSKNGTVENCVYEVYESPLTDNPEIVKSSTYGLSVSGKSRYGESDTSNNEENKKESKQEGKEGGYHHSSLEAKSTQDMDLIFQSDPEFVKCFHAWIEHRRRMRTMVRPDQKLFRRHLKIAERIRDENGIEDVKERINRAIDREWRSFDYPVDSTPPTGREEKSKGGIKSTGGLGGAVKDV